MTDRKRGGLFGVGVYVYIFGVMVCIYFLLTAWIRRTETNWLLDCLVAGPILVLFALRLFILAAGALKERKRP
jgi:hypothetical protein